MIAATIGIAGGKIVDGWRNDHLAERDAVLRHYIQLHPEDFPDPGKVSLIFSNFKFTNFLDLCF